MAIRMIARGRHIGTATLLWVAALLLVVAQVFAVTADGRASWRLAALAVSALAGVMIGMCILRGIGSVVAQVRIRRALRHGAAPSALQVRAEAQRGIAQIEAFLAQQQSHGA